MLSRIEWDLPHAPSSRPARDRFVGLLNKTEDFQCVVLGSLGLSDKAINSAIGLSQGQIQYRLRKARPALDKHSLTRRAWRTGESPFARALVSRAAKFLSGELTHTLRELPEAITYTPALVAQNAA